MMIHLWIGYKALHPHSCHTRYLALGKVFLRNYSTILSLNPNGKYI